MKYLKSFESLGSLQYEVITDGEFVEWDKLIDFSHMDKISNLLKDFDIQFSNLSKTSDRDFPSVDFASFTFNIELEYPLKIYLHIYEIEDEWFIVKLSAYGDYALKSMRPTMYKCDQWDGVVQLLKDKKIIK